MRVLGVLSLLSLIAACGGGGGGGPGPNPVASPPPAPTTSPPPTNRRPVVSAPIGDRYATIGQPFNIDTSQGGRTFADPEGDPLIYEFIWRSSPHDIFSDAPNIWGVFTQSDTIIVTVVARDPQGLTASDTFSIFSNQAPLIVRPNDYIFVDVGTSIDYEVTQNGTVFVDPDGSGFSYDITLRGAPHGLALSGTRVVGTFDSIGLVEIITVASDERGGIVEDRFGIVAAAPEPGKPSVPDTPFVYEDASLPLPLAFHHEDGQPMPFWDTTPLDNPITDAGAALGRVLFYDKRLSITNTAACGSCHDQATGFARPERFATGFQGDRTKRNAMGLTNVRFNRGDRYFSDLRAETLEGLVPMPIEDFAELGQPMRLLVDKLAATSYYPPLFEAAFGTPEVTSERITKALAQFLRSMISYQSKFDRAMLPTSNGPWIDPLTVFSPQEWEGFGVFNDRGCSGCHFTDVHLLVAALNDGLDSEVTDPGAIGGGLFRSASLRNIAVTAPYMHDGRFQTLREVIDHYDSGVRDNPFLAPSLRDQQTGEPLRLNLSEEEKAALEAFLNTLTDEAFLSDPKFADPF